MKGHTFVPRGNQSITPPKIRKKDGQQGKPAEKQSGEGKPSRTRTKQIQAARDKNPYFDEGGGNHW